MLGLHKRRKSVTAVNAAALLQGTLNENKQKDTTTTKKKSFHCNYFVLNGDIKLASTKT